VLQRSLKPARWAEYQASVAAVPLAVREAAFVEAADCFGALLGRAEAGERLLRALAALWALPPEAVQRYTSLHKPAVQAGGGDLSVGRATLPLLDAAAGRAALAAAAGAASRFAPTGHALRNMERVAAAACLDEPVLLVGETGTGKTTLVQQIAKQVGERAPGPPAARAIGLRLPGYSRVLARRQLAALLVCSEPCPGCAAVPLSCAAAPVAIPVCTFIRRWAPSWWCST
jgi:hypothetical protein